MSIVETCQPDAALVAAAEQQRVAVVRACAAGAAQAASCLQPLLSLVGSLLGYPQVRLNLVEEAFQTTIAADGLEAGEVIPREHSFCAQAILDPEEVLVVPDATADARFRDNPFVTDGALRAYVGAPLISSDGSALGALCATDRVPHTPSPGAIRTLRMLADAVITELEQSRALIAIADVTAALSRATDLDELHERICHGAVRAGATDGAVLVVRDGTTLEPAATSGPLPERFTLPVGPGSLTGRVCGGGIAEFHHADDPAVPELTRATIRRADACAIAAFPIGEPGPRGCAGVLVVWWRRQLTRLPETTRRTLTTLADHAAVALERATLLSRLEELSRTDPLTGLPNRRMLDDVLGRELARSARTGEPLTIAMVDLDHFKRYNDRFGHQAGDLLLCDAAQAWADAVRRSDVVARYGGEEFTLVLPHCDADSARGLVERVREATPQGATCSVGSATWDGIETPAALLERADRALYAAKRSGRDRAVFDSGLEPVA